MFNSPVAGLRKDFLFLDALNTLKYMYLSKLTSRRGPSCRWHAGKSAEEAPLSEEPELDAGTAR